MAKRKDKTVYHVVFFGINGKREEISVEATEITMLDGIDDSLICFNNSARTVFALPFRNLIHSKAETRALTPVTQLKAVK